MGKLNGAIITIVIFQLMMALFLQDGCVEGGQGKVCTYEGDECNLKYDSCEETKPNTNIACSESSVSCRCQSDCETSALSFIPGIGFFEMVTRGISPGSCSPSYCLDSLGEEVDGESVNVTVWHKKIPIDEGGCGSDCEDLCSDVGGTWCDNKADCENNGGTWNTDTFWNAIAALLLTIGSAGAVIAGLYMIKSDFAFYAGIAALFLSFGITYWEGYQIMRSNLGTVVPDIIILLFFIPIMISWVMIILDWIRGRD